MAERLPAFSGESQEVHATLRIRVQEVPSPLRAHPEIFRSPCQEMPQVRWPDRAGDLRPGGPVQGLRMVRHRLRQEVLDRFCFLFFQWRLGLQKGCSGEIGRLLKVREFFKVGEFEGRLEGKLERTLEEIRRFLKEEREEVMQARAPSLVLPPDNYLHLRL